MLTWFFDRLITWPEEITRVSLRVSGYEHRTLGTSFGDLSVIEAGGKGRTPFLLLHGFASEGVHYAPLMHLLRPHVSRLYVPDLPAHGRSAPPASPIHTGELRDEITEAFDQLLTEPTVLYGNSLGGLVALDYALSRPEKVRGLILCSPAGASMNDGELEAIRSTFKLRDYKEALAFVDRLFVKRHWLRPLVAWGVQRKFADEKLQTLLDALRPGDFLTGEELATLNVPTLLIWGKEDRILPRSCFEFLCRHMPPSTVIEEPEAQSHTPYIENPQGVAERILAFIRSVEDVE